MWKKGDVEKRDVEKRDAFPIRGPLSCMISDDYYNLIYVHSMLLVATTGQYNVFKKKLPEFMLFDRLEYFRMSLSCVFHYVSNLVFSIYHRLVDLGSQLELYSLEYLRHVSPPPPESSFTLLTLLPSGLVRKN